MLLFTIFGSTYSEKNANDTSMIVKTCLKCQKNLITFIDRY